FFGIARRVALKCGSTIRGISRCREDKYRCSLTIAPRPMSGTRGAFATGRRVHEGQAEGTAMALSASYRRQRRHFFVWEVIGADNATDVPRDDGCRGALRRTAHGLGRRRVCGRRARDAEGEDR